MERPINRGNRVHEVNTAMSRDIQRGVNWKHQPSKAVGQFHVFEAAKVWGTGNPRSSGATEGQRTVVSRRNISTFTVAGTAHLKN